MSTSIAQSRQQFAALVVAAQAAPQIITKHNTPVAVIVSADYFKRAEATKRPDASFYETLVALRAAQMPVDEAGLGETNRTLAWTRGAAFGDGE
jgi:prevent-host-death family protein